MRKLFTAMVLACAALAASAQKYVGGDISLLAEYEDHGSLYYDNGGNAIGEMLPFFKAEGLNAMRVRLFVDPSQAPSSEIGEGVCQDIEYVKALGKRIKDAGFALMLDFHYSDSWADPVKQYTPAAWLGLTNDELYAKIYEYTKESLQAMTDAGATPDMIQIGNEVSYGMLWGKRSSGNLKYYANGGTESTNTRFYNLLSNASKACREVCPEAKVIIHTERVGKIDYLKAFYQNMTDQNIDYDIIGLSYYPYYHGYLSQLENALTTLETAFADKRIMIVEAGYYHDWQPDGVDYDYSSTYPISEAGQKAFTEDLIETLKKHETVDGLFWWMMEANEYGLDWDTQRVTTGWYNAGLFDNQTGKAMSALSVLKDFADGSAGIAGVTIDTPSQQKAVYNLLGVKVSDDGNLDSLSPGLYIIKGKKVVVR